MLNLKSRSEKLALILFFFSGFSSLIYEVIWARMSILVFGSTIEAISAVITAFMLGLALGSYFAGKHSDYFRKHLRLYGITEVLIAISGFILYHLMNNIPFLVKFIYPTFSEDSLITSTLLCFLNFLLIVVPTTLMGATLPLMSKHFIRKSENVGLGLGLLYGTNTLGAVFGAFLCGFYLIPEFGVMETNYIAAAISLLLGIFAFILSGRDRRKDLLSPKQVASMQKGLLLRLLSNKDLLITMIVFTASGFAAMAYEVAWTRLLIQIIGNSTYAFSAILTVFLAGIALGSFILARFVDRSRDLAILFAVIELLIFICVAASLPFLDQLPFMFQFLFNRLFVGFASLEVVTFIVVISVIIVPTILMGATFPVVNRIITTKVESLGYSVGTTYSANTLGGIFGAMLAGFYYIPSFGVEKTILLISSINLFAALVLFMQSKRISNVAASLAIIFFGPFFAYYASILPDWNNNYINRGAYVYADLYKKYMEEDGINLKTFFDERYDLKFYREGKTGAVSVTGIGDILALQVGGKTEGSTGYEDMRTQTMIAALPLMLHGHAKDAAVIGLGTGITLGVMEHFPLLNIDCIELSRGVVEASRLFSGPNHDALKYENLNLIIGDGRSHLTYTDKKYDVIVNEPSNPWITGVSNLFTREFFEIAKGRLKRDGIMVQWIQLYGLKTKELRSLIHTYTEVFPQVSLWLYAPGDLIVLGSSDDVLDRLPNMGKSFYIPSLYDDLAALNIDSPSAVTKGFLFGTKKSVLFGQNAPLNTDNYPIVEFEAPKALFSPDPGGNIRALLACC